MAEPVLVHGRDTLDGTLDLVQIRTLDRLPMSVRRSEESVVPLLERLREKGWRLTAQRRAVAQALSALNLHLTAEEVFDRSAAILPEISRATVYNTLNDLVALGEVRLLSFDGGQTRRYDPNASIPHHHLVCSSCGDVRDVLFAQPAPALPRRDRGGYEVASGHIVYEGICAECLPR